METFTLFQMSQSALTSRDFLKPSVEVQGVLAGLEEDSDRTAPALGRPQRKDGAESVSHQT